MFLRIGGDDKRGQTYTTLTEVENQTTKRPRMSGLKVTRVETIKKIGDHELH